MAVSAHRRISRFVTLFLVANLSFWIYFAVSFVHESYPLKLDPLGHASGAGYTFFGYSIAAVENPYSHTFYRVMAWIQFPAFLLVGLGRKLIFSNLTGYEFFAGISEGGWRLLAIVLLSFLQWYLIGLVAEKYWLKLSPLRD